MRKIESWINRLIKHPRDRPGPPKATPGDYGFRLVIHALLFPLVTAFLMIDRIGGPLVLLAFTWTFLKYQRNEDRHTEDQAWKDIVGYMWALAIGSILYLALRRWV